MFSIEIAVQLTDFGANGVGYLDSAFGVGAILGGFVAIGRAATRKLATDFGVGVVFWALPLLLVAVLPQAAPAFLAMAIIGFANPIVDVNASTILQRLTPDAVLGRVLRRARHRPHRRHGPGLDAHADPASTSPGCGGRWPSSALGITLSCCRVRPRFAPARRLLGEPDGLPLLRQRPAVLARSSPSGWRPSPEQLGRREVAAGEVVIREGDAGDRFYIVESGRTTATHDGRGAVVAGSR